MDHNAHIHSKIETLRQGKCITVHSNEYFIHFERFTVNGLIATDF